MPIRKRWFDWKIFEENNQAIARNVLYPRKEKIYSAYVSNFNLNREKQVTLLMIPNGEKWHDLAVKETISIIKRNNV